MTKHTIGLSYYYTPIPLTKTLTLYCRLIGPRLFEIQYFNVNNIINARKRTVKRKRIIVLETKRGTK